MSFETSKDDKNEVNKIRKTINDTIKLMIYLHIYQVFSICQEQY